MHLFSLAAKPPLTLHVLSQYFGASLLILMLSACTQSEQDDQAVLTADSDLPMQLQSIDSAPSGSVLNANQSGNSSLNEYDLPDNAALQPRSPMIADATSTNKLGAILIGDYSGVLPCQKGQECETIVELNLFADGVAYKTSHQELPLYSTKPVTHSGPYQQADNIITIKFNNASTERYLIHDNQLILLQSDITNPAEQLSAFANRPYILSRH